MATKFKPAALFTSGTQEAADARLDESRTRRRQESPPQVMFLLLLKTTKNAHTSLDFVGMYETREMALPHVDREAGPFEPSGFGNYRMLGCRNGMTPKSVEETQVWQGSSYLLVEYGNAAK
jgi:hypothetical protein